MPTTAQAGSLSRQDCLVTVTENTSEQGIELTLTSKVIHQYGRRMKEVVQETLRQLNVTHVTIDVQDQSAFDYVIQARVEAAIARLRGQKEGFDWEVVPVERKVRANRLRRSMMFLNANTPSLLKDPSIYGPDSLIFDLEDAVSVTEKDAARFLLHRALQQSDYGDVERVVRVNGLDTAFYEEDIRCAVFAGCDAIRVPKVESAKDLQIVSDLVAQAEVASGRPVGSVLLMAAIESAMGVVNMAEICQSTPRLFGIALSGGDYTKDLHTTLSQTGVELMGARQQMVVMARAFGVQCFDTVFTDLSAMDAFRQEVELIHTLGFDGKSIINPRQIPIVHDVFTPSEAEVDFARRVVEEIDSKRDAGIGVFTIDGKMIDIAFYDGAKRTLALAQASGMTIEAGEKHD